MSYAGIVKGADRGWDRATALPIAPGAKIATLVGMVVPSKGSVKLRAFDEIAEARR